MPKVDIRAKAAEQARQDFGVEPMAVVPAEDVYTGVVVLLSDRAVFYKDLFGELERRDEYPYGAIAELAVNQGFGGQEISGRLDGKEIRLRRLDPADAELVLSCLRGRVPALELPLAEAIAVPPEPAPQQAAAPVPAPTPASASARHGRHARRMEPPEPEPTPVTPRAPVSRTTPEIVDAPSPAPTLAKKGAGCLAWIAIITAIVLGGYFIDGFEARLTALESHGLDVDRMRTELEALRNERQTRQNELEMLRADIADLRSSLVTGEKTAPWPTAPPLQPATADLGVAAERYDRPPSEQTYAVPVGDSPSRGPDNAWVTLLVLCDLQNPHCANANIIIAELRKDYSKDLRQVFKHLPSDLNDRAFAAAHAVECAREQGTGKFWRAHDHLLSHQRELSTMPMPELVKNAGGVAMPKWRKCYDAERYEERIAADLVLASSFGVDWAPAFFVNGRLLPGVQSQASLEAVITEELKKAKASGIGRAQYYRRAILDKGERP